MSCQLDVHLPTPLPDPPPDLTFDQTRLTCDPARDAIWTLIFDSRSASGLTRPVKAHAVPEMFATADGADAVLIFVVIVETGDSASLSPGNLDSDLRVQLPLKAMLAGTALPPIRYRTETHWRSGAIGISDWRETNATILIPTRTAP
jgi:hypothetical protein